MMSNVRLGLIGLLVLGLVAAGIGVASGLSLGSREYHAVLEHAAGIRVGEEVQVAGVGVGEVTGLRLDEDKDVVVDFTVDDDIHLGDRTAAEVKVATLLGTHYLRVRPGGSGDLSADTIPVDRTEVPFNLQDVLDAGTADVEQLDARAIERALGEVGRVLGRSGDDLGPALDGVSRLSQLVATRSDDLGRLLRAAQRVTGQLNSSSEDIFRLLRQADVVLDALRSRRRTIHALLQDLTTFGRQLSGVIEDTRADLGPLLRDIRRVSGVLQEHDAALDRALRMLAPTARYFANSAGTGPWLDQYAPGGTPDNLNCREGRSCG